MKKILAILIICLVGLASQVSASVVPEKELSVFKQSFPNLKVRFDAMVELPDGTQYIPVYPIRTEVPSGAVKVSMTIPKGKTLASKPDFFMYNTNFAFFKVKKQGNKTTFINGSNIPNEVKMGILPQDLLVPVGFQIPSDLRIIIGDLVIPVLPSEEYKEVNLKTGKVIASSRSSKTKSSVISAAALSNKYFYATSFNSNALTILNAHNGQAFKKIEFHSIPSDIKPVENGRYLLLTTLKNNEVFVIDTTKTDVLKNIKVGQKPFQIAVLKPKSLAYIANKDDGTISVIDLKEMKLKETIPVVGNPSYIAFSEDFKETYYLDSTSGTVYRLDAQDDYFAPYVSVPLFKSTNIFKIQATKDKMFALNRGNNQVEIYYFKGKTKIINPEVTVNQETTATKPDEADIKPATETKSVKEKIDFKETCRYCWRKLLYYPEDNKVAEDPINPENKMQVLEKTETDPYAQIRKQKAEAEKLAQEQNLSRREKARKDLKQYFLEFLDYKTEQPKENDEATRVKKIQTKLDFIKVNGKANDFVVANGKLYVLCADDYIIKVYDVLTEELLHTIELKKIGYYNVIKFSPDKSVGIVTNISSKELTVFDAKTDVIIQKLPLLVNVHNVVLTNKE